MPGARSFARLAAAIAALALPGLAQASGGNYVFDGGTTGQRAQVTAALDASAFDWSLVPRQITIHLRPGAQSEAAPGEIWLDADVFSSGRFAWGIVQHEYAHQVDFFLLDDAKRQQLEAALHGTDWCYAVPGLAHAQYGCERFASTLAWAYWPSADSAMSPASVADESAALAPVDFRALLEGMLGLPASTVTAPSSPALPAPAAIRQTRVAALVKSKRPKAPPVRRSR
jgi:hypothetical protein